MKLTQIAFYNSLWEKFVKDGNQKSLSKIYLDFYDHLFNYGLRYTQNVQIIEDSIQNIFSYFIKVRKNLSPVNNIFGYLLKAYRQQLFLDLKKQNKYVNMDIIPENDFDYFRSHEKLIIEKEELSIIKSALKTSLNALPPRLKEIIYFRFDLGLSYEDISAILNISVESCHKTTYRAVKAMRGEIKKSQHFSQIKFLVSRLSGLSEQ